MAKITSNYKVQGKLLTDLTYIYPGTGIVAIQGYTDSGYEIAGTAATWSPWEQTIKISDYYSCNNEEEEIVKKGYFPQFNEIYSYFPTVTTAASNSPRRLMLNSAKTALVIEAYYNNTWNADRTIQISSLKDKTIPKRFIVLLQAGGGGGGGGGNQFGGPGGGSGAHACFILDGQPLIDNAGVGYYRFEIGVGGIGGTGAGNGGSAGQPTKVYWYNSTSQTNMPIITVGGGKGGKGTETGGGEGGTVTKEANFNSFTYGWARWEVTPEDQWFEPYGWGHTGNNPAGDGSKTITAAANTICLFNKSSGISTFEPNYLQLTEHTGYGDSGGAPSHFGNGGRYKQYGDGNPGGWGAGGAGGDGNAWNSTSGGHGGSGFFVLYY